MTKPGLPFTRKVRPNRDVARNLTEKILAEKKLVSVDSENLEAVGADKGIWLKSASWRYWVVFFLFGFFFLMIGSRLIYLGVKSVHYAGYRLPTQGKVALDRPEMVDRNGVLLASDIKTASLFAEPQKIIDVDEVLEKLGNLFADLDLIRLEKRLRSKARFAWIKRKLTPAQQAKVYALGLPGLSFLDEPQRVYPQGVTAPHILGTVNLDNRGVSGIEKFIDRQIAIEKDKTDGHYIRDEGDGRRTVTLSIDNNMQYLMREELVKAKKKYHAIGATAIVMNIHNGEVLAMSSVPDFDPLKSKQVLQRKRFNRMTRGVFELGSVFKTYTMALGLEVAKAGFQTTYDVTGSIYVGPSRIKDFHGPKGWLSMPEIFIHSSNIGCARIADSVGIAAQRSFLKRLGVTARLQTEIGDVATPLLPRRWKKVNMMTIAFGHGISVAPLQFVATNAALYNGGYQIRPTFLKVNKYHNPNKKPRQIITSNTSKKMRILMRLNVIKGTGRGTNLADYEVGGKTGTADKPTRGGYGPDVISSFISIFPARKPKYIMYVMIDAPKGIAETHGKKYASVNAVPMTASLIQRLAPFLGLKPQKDIQPWFDMTQFENMR